MFLAGLAVWSLFFVVVILVWPAGLPSKLKAVPGFILMASVFSGIQVFFAYLCRLVGIANLYASMLLFSAVFHLATNALAGARSPTPPRTGSFLLGFAYALGVGVAFSWLSLKLDSIFRKEPKTKVS